MTKTVMAEYLADEQKLRLDAPLEGVADHEKVRVAIEPAIRPTGGRPWLELRDSLPAPVAEHWRQVMIGLRDPDPDDQ